MAEQKLNIVFTGDVSQLTKAIQSAEAELTSFENKLKDSLGTEAFASVNQAVDQLRQKFKTLSSIDIKANPQQALTAINEVFTDISKLKSSEVLLKANNKEALAAIAQLENFASNIKGTISINIDRSQVTTQIEQIKKEIESIESLKIEPDVSPVQLELFNKNIDQLRAKLAELESIQISFDTSGIASAVESIRAKALSVFEIDISADPAKALAAIDAVQADIDEIRKNKILLEVDSAPALASIDKIESELQGLRAKITIDPSGFDVSKLQNLIKPLSTQVAVGVNTRQAEVEIKALLEQVRNLKGQDILINLDGTQVVRTIDAIEKELLQLQSKLKLATDPREIAKLTQSLQTFKNSLSATSVNQFSSTMNRAQNATFAFSQVLREAPAFAFSFQTGLLALSNNLPILADRFKEARASGLSFGKILGDMGKSLFSLPGIMTIASTAAIFLAGAFNKSGKSAKDFTEELEDTRNVLSDSAASVQGDIARVQALANAFKESEGSFDRQKRIISELKEVNESYFGDLKAGVSTYADITKAANAYTDALVQEAVIKGLSNAISKLSEQLGDATIKYADATKAADDQRRVLEETERANRTNVQGLTAQNREVNVARNSYNKFQAALRKAGEEVGAINTRIEEFRKLINLKVFEQLKIKPLVDPKVKKDFEKDTDDIVARARLFAKQFGETFVVPDLDESFTNTKDKIKKSAIKLFDDLAKGQLKIKIPVQIITEADLVAEERNPIPQAELDRLQAAYLEQLRKEFEEPFKVDLTIAPQVELEKAKERFRKAVQDGRFEDALDEIRIEKKDSQGNSVFEELDEQAKTMAKTINETLTPAFQSFFDALIEGKNPIKAFFDSIVQSINQVIKKLIQAAIQAAILSAISGGTSSFGGLFKGLLGLGSVASPGGGGFIGGVGGSTAGGTLTARVSGTDLLFVLNQGQNIVGRSG